MTKLLLLEYKSPEQVQMEELRARKKALGETIKLTKQNLDLLLQLFYKTEETFSILKKEHDSVDYRLAMLDGRFKVVPTPSKSTRKPKEPTESEMVKKLKSLSQSEIDELIKQLGEEL